METFGKRLRVLRMEYMKTGEELGKVFNVTKTAISNWENGNRFPDEKTLVEIAEYFNVSIDYLLGRTEIKNSHDKEEIITIAAHYEGDEFTEEELSEIEKFKEFVRMKKKQQN